MGNGMKDRRVHYAVDIGTIDNIKRDIVRSAY